MKLLGVIVLACATLATAAACGSDSSSWAGIRVDFATADSTPSWSPDGRLIAFASNRDGGGIFVVRPDGSGIRRLTATNGKAPRWSPDGKELAFEAQDGVRLISPDGTRERLLVPAATTDERSLWPTWSPNGKRLAFVREDANGAHVVYVVPRAGGKPRRMLKPALSPDDPNWSILTASEITPSWSPDGKLLAYDSGDGVLVVADIATGKRKRIFTEGAAYQPAWSPDGSEIAFQCAGNLCIVDLRSGALRTLLGDAGSPSWSPDGNRVVVERYLFGTATATSSPMALYSVAADESGSEPVTFGPGEVDED